MKTNEPNWAKLIDYVYREPETVKHRMLQLKEHDLIEETGLSEEEVERSMEFLERQGLISKNPTNETVPDGAESLEEIAGNMGWEIELTEKGFQVAHEREIAKREDDRNVTIVILTFILAGTSAIRAMNPILGKDYLTVLATLVFLILLVTIWRTDFTW